MSTTDTESAFLLAKERMERNTGVLSFSPVVEHMLCLCNNPGSNHLLGWSGCERSHLRWLGHLVQRPPEHPPG